ncbi:hypothetical protein CEXT_69691 [Caerostris extrusa]|uniref:Uncharacterized protein n=1 Tax=Caerostris extrusa TaxID=172846 RepID=A0AAV4R1R6_CAEEX|nr:hypothetical protein CEXT_69691 [Caerostris extrusa]
MLFLKCSPYKIPISIIQLTNPLQSANVLNSSIDNATFGMRFRAGVILAVGGLTSAQKAIKKRDVGNLLTEFSPAL